MKSRGCLRMKHLISYPTTCQLERHHLLEIMQCVKRLLQGQRLLCPTLPDALLRGSNDQILIASEFWHVLGEDPCQQLFYIILMSNEQITVWAITACLVEREQEHRIDMDDQRELALMHLLVTLWTARKARILVRIEEEAITRRLLPKPPCRFLFSRCHFSPYPSLINVIDCLSLLCLKGSLNTVIVGGPVRRNSGRAARLFLAMLYLGSITSARLSAASASS